MIKKTDPTLAELYIKHLKTINYIHFTLREIELISCLLSGRGVKKIALLLNISPKTAETHIRNITSKLSCNSREGIIDFIEKSEKLEIIKEFYNNIIYQTKKKDEAYLLKTKKKKQKFVQKNPEPIEFQSSTPLEIQQKSLFKALWFPQTKKYFFVSLIFLTIFLCLFTGYHVETYNAKDRPSIRSDLIVPTDVVFLRRSDLIAKIDEKFKNTKGIQILALIGSGGAGKTTLARHYAHEQKSNIIWEINSEGKNSLIKSFENLAYALSTTEADKRTLNELKEIKNTTEREKKLVEIVKFYLKPHSSWLLIYDNVEKLIDIQKYLPLDSKTWGTGRVILTTRDRNIQSNKYVGKALIIGELDAHQKIVLFTKIITHGVENPLTPMQITKAKKFLKQIPSFPLDVSVAAYYIKETGISYEKYLTYLKEQNIDYLKLEESLLQKYNYYPKNRYGIVSLSVKKIMESCPDFLGLLLCLCLLNSQNIPRELLDSYKNSLVVDNFIYKAKSYSLIVSQSNILQSAFPAISIHPSTQELSFLFLTKALGLQRLRELIEPIFNALENVATKAIESEDYSKMSSLITHYETCLTHNSLFSDSMKGSLQNRLGIINFYFSNLEKAKYFLEESYKNLVQSYEKNYREIALTLVYLGVLHRGLSDNVKAKEFLEKSLKIYKRSSGKSTDMAFALTHLGDINKNLGNNKKAKELLEESLIIYKKYPQARNGMARTLSYLGIAYRAVGDNEKSKEILEQSLTLYKQSPANLIGIARVSTHLGNVYRKLGNNTKALKILNEGIAIYRKMFSEDYVEVAWAAIHAASIYRALGNYNKAINMLEQSLLIYRKNYSASHIKIAWALKHLGNAYRSKGDYKKAREALEESYSIYKKHPEDDYGTARLFRNLGQVYLLQKHYEAAENFTRKSLEIFQERNHPESYLSLEVLAELYHQKSLAEYNKGNSKNYQKFNKKCITYLIRALKIIKTYYPKDSPHITRIQSNIIKIQ